MYIKEGISPFVLMIYGPSEIRRGDPGIFLISAFLRVLCGKNGW
jgi:hypothetical protein